MSFCLDVYIGIIIFLLHGLADSGEMSNELSIIIMVYDVLNYWKKFLRNTKAVSRLMKCSFVHPYLLYQYHLKTSVGCESVVES